MILVVDEKCRLRTESRGDKDDNVAFIVRLFRELYNSPAGVGEVPTTVQRTRSGELLLLRQKKRGDGSLINWRESKLEGYGGV